MLALLLPEGVPLSKGQEHWKLSFPVTQGCAGGMKGAIRCKLSRAELCAPSRVFP